MRRFINADVVAGEISNAITLNRFAYANGNPVSMSDPFGLSAADQRGNASFNPVLELHKDPILYYVEQAIVNEQNASKQIYTGTHTPFTMAGFPMINPNLTARGAGKIKQIYSAHIDPIIQDLLEWNERARAYLEDFKTSDGTYARLA